MKGFSGAIRAAAIVALGAFVAGFSACGGKTGQETVQKEATELPAAVAQAVEANCPGAVIDKLTIEKEAGLSLYDIEFKAGRGEIEVAEDGTVVDVATIVALADIPEPAAEAIRKAAGEATITQVEKSEVRARIEREGGQGQIVGLAEPEYVYEAELAKGELRGEIQVGPDGKIVEGPKWGEAEESEAKEAGESVEAEEREKAEEAEEAAEVGTPTGVDLKILPAAVLEAFETAYPHAVITGTSREVEKGVTYYEIESVDGKMNRDLLYTADGTAVEVEEALAPGALPEPVLKALAEAYPGYKVLKAEELTKEGRKLFELQIQVKDKKIAVSMDPSGKIIE